MSVGEVVRSGPTTYFQRRFAERHAALSNRAVLNVTLRLDLHGALDVAALERALSALVDRHHALRTRFRNDDGNLVQEVLEATPAPLPVVDLGAERLAPEEHEDVIAHWCQRQALVPFDIEDQGLVRFALAAVTDGRWVLSVVQHHIVTDAASTAVLLSDLVELYAAGVERRPADLPPQPAQLLEVARWQQDHLTGRAIARSVAFWRDELDGATFSLPLPGERPRPDALSGAGELLETYVPVELAEQLTSWGRRHGVTTYAVLVATYAHLLCDLTDQDEVVITAAFQNRTHGAFERVVGQLANTLPLRLPRCPEEEIGETMRRTSRRLWSYADHQELPFPMLLEQLGIRERPGAARFPQTWLTLHPRTQEWLDMPGLRARVTDVAIPGARSDLGMLAVPGANGLRLWVEASDYLGTSTVQGWLARYVALLRSFAARPAALVRDW